MNGWLPVTAFFRRQRRPPGPVELLKPRTFDLERLGIEMEFVRSVVIVETDDRIARPGFAVVERVLDAVRKPVGLRNLEYASPCDGPVRRTR
jgi:hypothetical protein